MKVDTKMIIFLQIYDSIIEISGPKLSKETNQSHRPHHTSYGLKPIQIEYLPGILRWALIFNDRLKY
jgi:hypothetical protein